MRRNESRDNSKKKPTTGDWIMGLGGVLMILGVMLSWIWHPSPKTRITEGIQGGLPIFGLLLAIVGVVIKNVTSKKKG